MIKLETEFVSGVGGFATSPLHYKQLMRNGMYAVYQRSNSDGRVKDYETIHIKVIPKGTKIFDTITPDDAEQYATTSTWGKFGWSYTNLGAATNKYNQLIKCHINDSDSESATTTLPDNKDSSINNIESSNNGSKHRGRVAVKRSPISFPTTTTWTMKDILVLNPDYQQATMYLALKTLISDNKVKIAGTQKSPSGRGKSMILYSNES